MVALNSKPVIFQNIGADSESATMCSLKVFSASLNGALGMYYVSKEAVGMQTWMRWGPAFDYRCLEDLLRSNEYGGFGIPGEWVSDALVRANGHKSSAAEWIMDNQKQLAVEHELILQKEAVAIAIENLHATGFPTAWCSKAVKTLDGKVRKGTAEIMAADVERQALQWLQMHADELNPSGKEPRRWKSHAKTKFAPASSKSSSSGGDGFALMTQAEAKAEAQRAIKQNNSAAASSGTAQGSSVYREFTKALEAKSDINLLSMPATSAKVDGAIEKFEEERRRLASTRAANEEELALCYSRTSLVSLLKYAPNNRAFGPDFIPKLIRLVESSLAGSLDDVSVYLRGCILGEARGLAGVAAQEAWKGLTHLREGAPVAQQLIGEVCMCVYECMRERM
jgi:hypothetical protein